MKYTKTFDVEATDPVVTKRLDAKKLAAGDRRDGLVYLYTPEIELTVNIALATTLSALPLPSPASGFTYSYDPASGGYTLSTQSFGPILAERAIQ